MCVYIVKCKYYFELDSIGIHLISVTSAFVLKVNNDMTFYAISVALA